MEVSGSPPTNFANGKENVDKSPESPNFPLQIRVEDFDSGKPRSNSLGADPRSHKGQTLLSTSLSGHLKERQNSFKFKKPAILHNLLHPLDFYNERKARSRSNSCSSDIGDFDGEASPRARTPEPRVRSRPSSPNPSSPGIRFGSAQAWPIYKPAVRQRPRYTNQNSCPANASWASTSPAPSPSSSPGHISDRFYKEAMRSNTSRYSDGHRLHKEKDSWDSDDDSNGSSSDGSHSSYDSSESDIDHEDASKSISLLTPPKAKAVRSHSLGPFVPEQRLTPSPGTSPTNKFLISVLHQESPSAFSSGVMSPKSDSKSRPKEGRRGSLDSGKVSRRRNSSDDHHEKRNIRDRLKAKLSLDKGDGRAANSIYGKPHRRASEHIERASSVEKLYSIYDQIILEGIRQPN